MYKNGYKLGAFKKASKGRFNPDDYALRDYSFEEVLPWDFIEMRPEKAILIERNKQLLNST